MNENPPTQIIWDFEHLQMLYKKLSKSLITIHREACLIDELSSILEYLQDSAEKMKTECLRVGAVPRSSEIKVPSSKNLSVEFSIQQMSTAISTLSELFTSLNAFLCKYNDEDFRITSYINMNRVSKAERLLQQAQEKMEKLYRFSLLLKFQSLGQIFVCVHRILKKVRNKSKVETTLLFHEPEARKPKHFEILVGDESLQEPLFTGRDEDKKEIWPVSPIRGQTIDFSVNNSLGLL